MAGNTAMCCDVEKRCFQLWQVKYSTALVYCTLFSMQPCRCLQECHPGGCLHHDHHRLWLGRCAVRCPRGEILRQSKHGLPETATGIRKTWCWSGKWTTKKSCETQLQVRSWIASHYFGVCLWCGLSDSLFLLWGNGFSLLHKGDTGRSEGIRECWVGRRD